MYKRSLWTRPPGLESDALFIGGQSNSFMQYSTTRGYGEYHQGASYNFEAFGAPKFWNATRAKPGLFYDRSFGQAGSAGFLYDKKWSVATMDINGHTPGGLLTGQKFHGSEPDPRDNYATAAIFDPATKSVIKEIEIGRYTWCWGGNSRGQFILESDSFDNYYQFASAFMYDINTDQISFMGNGWTPDVITEDGTVYGREGLGIRSWTKSGGLKREYSANDVGVNMQVVNVLPNKLLFGLDGRKSNGNIEGWFFLQNGEYFDLNNQVIGGLLPAGYDKWTNYCYMTPEGVIMQALQNSATGKFETHMLTPVPEPATLAALGFGALLLRRRRMKS